MDLVLFFEKGLWLGIAALGFALLFNVPKRALFPVFIIGSSGGLMKFFMMDELTIVVLPTFCGATLIGFLSVAAAHRWKTPPISFAIPAVIPMIPGFFAYKAMIGVIQLTAEKDPEKYSKLFFETFNNGLTTLFVLIVLAIGVALPLLLARKTTVKRVQSNEEGTFL
ncbi:threonine/serine exporter family protein [Flavobacterium sp. RSSA_27]|uniref:threonine/serine exporter family protein n=1 Tax=Flavobacterium sp. RSSA_27 TaxID=3447667 RepID=UPI003F329753